MMTLLTLSIVGVMTMRSLNAYMDAAHGVTHTHHVITHLERMLGAFSIAESNQRGYVITGEEKYKNTYEQALEDMDAEYNVLLLLLSENPSQTSQLNQLAPLLAQRKNMLYEGALLRQQQGVHLASRYIQEHPGHEVMNIITQRIRALEQVEGQMLEARQQLLSQRAQQTIRLLMTSFLIVLLLLGFAYNLIQHEIKRRQKLEVIAQQLNQALAKQVTDMEKLNTSLQTANQELESFSYSVSHDLRAPLRSIDGYSQALLEDLGDRLAPSEQGFLQRIRENTQHMGNLIDDLLTLSRISRGNLQVAPVAITPLAEQILNRLQELAPERVVETQVEQGLMTEGDPQLLRLVLENLLDNAWKFTSKNPRGRIEVGHREDPNETVFFIRDNGVGFDMAYVNKLFTPFQRLHAITEFPGNGIGLATVQRILQRHGGRAWAEGHVNDGATFYFTLKPSS